jgi:hypothetical protein
LRKRLRNDTNVIDAGHAQSVYDFGKDAKGYGFIGAEEDGVLGLFELSLHLSAETIDVDWRVADIDELVFVDGNNQPNFVDFFDGGGFGDIDFDAGLEDGSSDHENDEENENNVNERDHVDLGEGGLRLFRELRHSFQGRHWAGRRRYLSKSLFDLSTDFKSKSV